MSQTALVLVLAAAVAHALWNIVAARSSGSGVPFLFWGAVVSAAIWVFAIPATGGLGTASLGHLALGVGVSGLLHVAYMLVLQRGYAAGEISTVYATARGSGPVLTVLVSVLLFGERPGLLSLGGVVLVIAGVVAFGVIGMRASASKAEGAAMQRTRAARGSRIDPAILFGLLMGVAIAIYTVWDVHTVNGFGAAPVAFMVGTSLAQAVLFGVMLLTGAGAGAGAAGGRRPGSPRALAAAATEGAAEVRGGTGRGRSAHQLGSVLRSEFRANWRSIVVFAVLSPLSYVLVLTATTLAPLSLVAPMREVSVVLVGLYGAIRYRESNPGLRLTAAVVVVAGVALIGL